ncbi:MAG: acyl-CoA thioesterase [Bacteriovoracaceae bacterium]|nr:acyl-CoA thioesterase [Bacteriovoracaceae bacterium]
MTSPEDYLTTITSDHLDFLGHVNNARYLEILEEARWHLYAQLGYTKQNAIEEKKAPIVIENRIKYRKELTTGERVRVVTKYTEYTGMLGQIKQVIYKENGKKSCCAEVTIAFFEMIERKLIRPVGLWRDIHLLLLTKK